MVDRGAAQGLERLRDGNARYLERVADDRSRQKELARGQQPFAIVLACADSRVVPEVAFDAEIGELFVVRVAGNVANRSTIASIEHAVAQLGVRLIIVLAHENCGAVAAAQDGVDAGENLRHLLAHITPALAEPGGRDADAVARRSARLSAKRLVEKSEILRDAERNDGLRIVTAFFHIATGTVDFD
jgi:carbonic anhydrase